MDLRIIFALNLTSLYPEMNVLMFSVIDMKSWEAPCKVLEML